MKSPISPDRLKELRTRNRLRQGELAERSGISKDTISRLERGVLPGNRKHTIDQLSEALGVLPGVLTGELPLPDADKGRVRERRGHVKVGMRGSHLNALFLVARRYKVPMVRILEIAPVLFLYAAEESLQWRRQNLRTMKSAYQMRSKFDHLNAGFLPKEDAEKLFNEEEGSISSNDIMASVVSMRFAAKENYGNANNPFSNFLQEKSLAYSEDLISQIDFKKDDVSYWACKGDIVDIIGDYEDDEYGYHADSHEEGILFGDFMLSDMPKHLWSDDAIAERQAWFDEVNNVNTQSNNDIISVIESEVEEGTP